MKGPDPTGLFEISSGLASRNILAGRMLLENSETSERNGAHGSLRVITSVWSSAAAMLCTASRAHFQGQSRSWARCRDQAASAAVTGSPVDHLASGRR